MIYLISDTHFNHSNIIEYCNRPFENVRNMNLHMIEEWNKIVTPNDIVFHLGDVAFGDYKQTKDIINSLNGYKILIKGNHDRKGESFYLSAGFSEIYKKLEIGDYILSHKPIENLPENTINIHGHIHNIDITTINYYKPQSYINVCVEVTNYKPKHFPELESIFKNRY